MTPTTAPPMPHVMSDETRGLWLGAVGVVIFAMTLPMTRLAVGPVEAPQLSPLFVTAGRAALAGLLSLAYLAMTRAPRPRGVQWRWLAISGSGVVVGFPLFVSLALRQVDAMHAAVVTGLLPLGTAAVGALVLRQRASLGFWACAALGSAIVLAFAWQAGGGFQIADGLLLLSVLTGSVGYVWGARLASQMSAEQAICWVLVLSLPITVPLMLWAWPAHSVRAASWGGFAYVTLFSMWIGFFAWYRGMALGGTLRVSQVQLIQPFLALLFAVPVLGEELRPSTVVYSLAIIATVFAGKRMKV